MKEKISEYISGSIKVKNEILNKKVDLIEKIVSAIINSYKNNGKLIVFGNGGSAADAQHMAAEFVGRFKLERDSLPAIALTCNTSSLTAIGNDYGYDNIFSRQLQAFLNKNDIVIGISTSGKSQNVINAIKYAKKNNALTVVLTGMPGLPLANIADIGFIVPTEYTPIVQEAHITIIHIICKLVEEELCNQ